MFILWIKIVLISIIKLLLKNIIALFIMCVTVFILSDIFIKLLETEILLKKWWLIKILNTIMTLLIHIQLIIIELYTELIFTCFSHQFKNVGSYIIIWIVHIILGEDLLILFQFCIINWFFTNFLVIHSFLIALFIFVLALKYTLSIAHFYIWL